MAFDFPPFTSVFFVGGILALFFASVTWARRPAPGALPFTIFLLGAAVWTFANAFEAGAAGLADKIFWGKVMYFGALSTGAMWFSFSLDYTGSTWWRRPRNLAALYLVPLVSLPIIWTNQWTGWFWSEIYPSAGTSGTILIYQHGPWFWVQCAYQYALLIGGFFRLSLFMIHKSGLHRQQLITLSIATFIPIAGNALYISGHSPVQGLDLTPFAMTISGLIYAVTIFYFRFLDVVPVARSTLVENMTDGIVVLNSDAFIVDMNPAASRMLGSPRKTALGKQLIQAWPGLDSVVTRQSVTGDSELLMEAADSRTYLDVRVTPLQDSHRPTAGQLVVLRDVTESRKMEQILRERANIDELTGLYNHRHFHQRLDEETARCSRFGDVFSLLSIDLDLFKAYNDIYGHLEGDEILRKVGGHIRGATRMIDIGFRYGGDEFAVILPGTPISGAFTVGERIRKLVDSEMDMKNVPLTCCIGIASWPANGLTREELVRAADAAMYYAKLTGRNRTCVASDLTRSQMDRAESGPDNGKSILNTIYALAATVDAKDHHTYGHSRKVSKYSTDIAEALGFTREKVDEIRGAALLHDIGKLGVSDVILRKVGELTDEERKSIRTHPDIGVSIVKHVDNLNGCLAGIHYHHEHFDGSGYPSGLRGTNIPLDARIIAVADAYDAMTSSRPYREEMSPTEALKELESESGRQFDPEIVRVFLAIQSPVSPPRAAPREGLISRK
jgi:diguanylate cyclase (GGDEF)-like protein/PAS domain S-box-containing protein